MKQHVARRRMFNEVDDENAAATSVSSARPRDLALRDPNIRTRDFGWRNHQHQQSAVRSSGVRALRERQDRSSPIALGKRMDQKRNERSVDCREAGCEPFPGGYVFDMKKHNVTCRLIMGLRFRAATSRAAEALGLSREGPWRWQLSTRQNKFKERAQSGVGPDPRLSTFDQVADIDKMGKRAAAKNV